MDYSIPTARDLADVHSLNAAFLEAMHCSGGEDLRRALPVSCQPLIASLTELKIRRLAAAPFLLFSIREQDDAYWQQLLDADPHRDLFAVNDRPVAARSQIIAAAIGFAWQLARRDPYIARLVCGASFKWCQRLASMPLIGVLDRAAERADLMLPRLAENEQFWRRLLGAGLSADLDVRNAAQLAALQMVLTGLDIREHRRLQSAACRTAVPIIKM